MAETYNQNNQLAVAQVGNNTPVPDPVSPQRSFGARKRLAELARILEASDSIAQEADDTPLHLTIQPGEFPLRPRVNPDRPGQGAPLLH